MAITVAPNVRAIEEQLRTRLGTRANGPNGLPSPVRLLVPTPQDRAHWAVRLVAGDQAYLGVRVQSLVGFVRELAAGEQPVGVLLEIVTRRLIRHHPLVAALLERFDAAEEVVVGPVVELLEAGLDSSNLDVALEVLAGGSPRRQRARELVSLAAASRQLLDAAELVVTGDLIRRGALRLLEEATGTEGHVNGVETWGVGLSSDLRYDQLVHNLVLVGCRWWVDLPQKDSGRGDRARGARQRRLEQLGTSTVGSTATSALRGPTVVPTVIEATTFADQVQAVLDEIEQAIAAGVAPERVALVGFLPREVGAVATQLEQRGIAFCAADFEGSPTATSRRAAAVAEVLEIGAEVSVRTWFVAAGWEEQREVALGLAARGLRRLARVAEAPASPGGAEKIAVEAWVERARDLVARLARIAAATSAAAGFEELLELGTALDLPPHLIEVVANVVAELRDEIPSQLALEPGELGQLAARQMRRATRPALTPDRGGVRVLRLDTAVGTSWDLAVVVGATAGALDASVAEDPLLPESTRRELRVVLPDLVSISDRAELNLESMWRLLGASARVVLAWSHRDLGGAVASPSAAVAQALASGAPRRVVTRGRPKLPAGEVALGWALGDRRLARQRLAVADAIDSGIAGLGLRLGRVAPRSGHLWATQLEAIARCPWQVFLERVLKLQAPVAETEALGALHNRLVGALVHSAVELAAANALGRRTAGEVGLLRWPEGRGELEAELLPLARELVQAEGVPELAEALAFRAAVFVRVLAALPALQSSEVLASERVGLAPLASGSYSFRADLVLAGGAGERLVDFKLAPPPSGARSGAAELVAAVAAGRRLQAPLYAAAGGVEEGIFAFVGDSGRGQEGAERWVVVRHDSAPVRRALEQVVALLEESWQLGAAIPRLVDATLEVEGQACRDCRVSEACFRGDSRVRGAVVGWLETPVADEGAAAKAARRVMRLGSEQ